ncbi:MAG TPA: IclR family transcriptional regulator [Gaiellaceae bacterium]
MARTGKPAERKVAAVERALAVIDALEAGEELGTNELARRAGLNASTTSRLLATLAGGRLVEHVEETGRYRLGPRLIQLGNAVLARLDLREAARPYLRALVEATGETATLSAPGDPDAVTVDFVQGPGSVVSVARLGRPSVAHATATGKVGLAFGEARLPEGVLERFTEKTITDRALLDRELTRIRTQGFAEAAGEREGDLNAVAAPVFGSRGELAAVLGVQGPAARFDRAAMRQAAGPLLELSRAASDALGWTPDLTKESE